MFIRKATLCLVLGLAVSGGVLADDDAAVSAGLIVGTTGQDSLIAMPAGPIDDAVRLDETVVIFNEPKKDDGMLDLQDRIVQTVLPTQMGGIESQSGVAESLNDFTGHPDLQELDQDEVLMLDNLATSSSKGLLKLKKTSE